MENLNFKDRKIIAVIGGRDCGEEIYNQAEDVGRLIARRNGILICGGRTGVMEAACKGAYKTGGMTIGILPGSSKQKANQWVKLALPTGLGPARNSVIINSCDSAIAIDGNYGTLSEIAYCFQFNKSVCVLNSWEIEGTTPVASPKEAIEFAFSHESGPSQH